jgi:hypothetical protein
MSESSTATQALGIEAGVKRLALYVGPRLQPGGYGLLSQTTLSGQRQGNRILIPLHQAF